MFLVPWWHVKCDTHFAAAAVQKPAYTIADTYLVLIQFHIVQGLDWSVPAHTSSQAYVVIKSHSNPLMYCVISAPPNLEMPYRRSTNTIGTCNKFNTC